jgi:hypothetical protein
MKTKNKIVTGVLSLIAMFGVGLLVWAQQPSVDCRLEKQRGGGEFDVCLKMSQLGGTCSISTSVSSRVVSAFLSLHEGRCSSF